ncbi:MAG: CBS domain-containing protein [Anaerolineae bacterium]|jgi:CBS domain-containing protein|nr:CBS domain-containing protein [Anaerolineae bacterium]
MTTVDNILRDKGREVWAVPPTATVYNAMRLMADQNIGAVLVMDGDNLAGILSERDCARQIILPGRDPRATSVSDIMTPRVVFARGDQSAEECMALMTEKRIRHLPILDEANRVVGVVTTGDLGKAIIARQEFTIAHLETYITGSETLFNRSV